MQEGRSEGLRTFPRLTESLAHFCSVGAWNGTAYGLYAYTPANTGAILFDGATGYVDLGSRTFGGAFSLAFWGRYDTAQTWSRFFDFGSDAGTSNILFAPTDSNGALVLQAYGSGAIHSNCEASGSAVPTGGVWSHFVVSVSASGSAALYLNGALVCTNDGFGPVATVTFSNLFVGRSWWPGDPYLSGGIGDLQLALGTALTAYDAANLYAGLGCPPPPPPPPLPPPPPSPPGVVYQPCGGSGTWGGVVSCAGDPTLFVVGDNDECVRRRVCGGAPLLTH